MRITIQEVIDLIVRSVPGAPTAGSVDVIKAGDPAQPVNGVVTTFLATHEVLQRAVDLGANLVITHEPTFYNHLDEVDWLADDSVYAAKRRFIDEHHLVIWRFHDYWHMHRPDGILTGTIRALGWNDYANVDNPRLYDIPPTPLDALATSLKEKLGIHTVRVVGRPDLVCKRAFLALGAMDGKRQIHLLGQPGTDVLICGEINEWEASEYARDATYLGQPKALIILGHANSEEAGMSWLVDWLHPRLPDVPITHVPAGDPFRFL
jgi:putative NIF3 family GTP cyclohydrolase 1 type 2